MSTSTTGRREAEASDAAAPRPRLLEAGEIAWLAAVPCAALVVVAILVLGPPLASLQPPADDPAIFFPENPALLPEPVEHARYAIALLGPLLLAAVVLAGAARPPALRPALARALRVAAGAVAVAFLALCLLAQNSVLLRANVPPAQAMRFFDEAALATAAALALLLVAAVRRWGPRLRRSATAEPRAARLACLALAAALTATWLLTAVNTETTIANPPGNDLIPWDMSETFAILDGRTPLVDFHAQYSQLWPYAAAVALALFGTTIGVWTTTMAAISGLALLAVYATFRRIVRSSALALALYVPFLATGFFSLADPGGHRFNAAGIYSAWPLRYAGPYLLAWLTARHCDGAAPRRTWLLFAAAGLVAINNPEFGLGALAGSLLALACVRRVASARDGVRLLGAAAAGVGCALALVALLTLLRTGTLPRFGLALEFPRLYGVDGWFVGPMAPIGIHTAMYVTFAAALVTAVVRAVRGGEEAALTAMLAWCGPFGLIAGSYYVGASNPLTLFTLFSAWCLALALLVVAVVRALAARPRRLPGLPALAVLFGFGLAVCSVPQIPAPWSQLERLRAPGAPIYRQQLFLDGIAPHVRRGEKVAIVLPLGHRLAYDLGVVNVAPYSGPAAMPTRPQVRRTIEAMRREGARKLFLDPSAHPEFLDQLRGAGFKGRGDGIPAELIDRR
jgi:hypothetical protein